METKYKIVNDTAYHKDTNDNVIRVLENFRQNKVRIKIDLGNVKTGKSWNDSYDTCGYIGRSSGQYKIPLLIHNSRSFGGPGILDHCIIKISYANKKNGTYDLYKHPDYHQ